MTDLCRTYPTPPLSEIPAVLLSAFQAERAIDNGDFPHAAGGELSEFEVQRVYATYRGASLRVRECCGLRGHDTQAAALLMAISDLDVMMQGAYRYGGEETFRYEMDPQELQILALLRQTLAALLEWHFENGAGALLPIADWLGLVRKERAA